MTIGFLPGTETKGVRTVVAADAHAWPELYLGGIGWTRFEPTPSRGAPPAYAIPPRPPGTAANGDPKGTATAPAPRAAARKDLGNSPTGKSTGTKVGVSPASVLQWLTRGWGPALFGALIGLLGSLVVPTAALWRRRRRLGAARTAAERIEVQWELLTSSLGDLGITPEPSRTPRQQRAYYDGEAFLDVEASQALGRVVQTLERSRYAQSPPPPHGVGADARHVLRAAAATRRGTDRLRAAMWPSSGIAGLRSARAHLAWRIRTPLRCVRAVIQPRLPRHRSAGTRPAPPR